MASRSASTLGPQYILALNCGSSSLKLKLFALQPDDVQPASAHTASGAPHSAGTPAAGGQPQRHHLRRLSSASSLSFSSTPATTELPQGIDLLVAASISLKGEGDKRAATLKWARLPPKSVAAQHDKITLKSTEIASEAFLDEVLDRLAHALTTTSNSSKQGGTTNSRSNSISRASAPAGPTHASQSQSDLRDGLRFITHRVVHGAAFPQPFIIRNGDHAETAERLRTLENLEALAPLHNVVSTRVIKLCLQKLPRAVNLAAWDTSFHASMSEEVRTYPVWQPDAVQLPGGMELRKWGFHGLSYASVLRQVSAFLERPASSLNLIIAHLGSGASICAIRAGKSIDTSMGLTPLEGLPGSTRSGSVDPALSHHLKPDSTRHGVPASELDLSEQGRVTVPGGEGLQLDWAEWELNSKSGWLAIAGVRDFEEIVARKDGREHPPGSCSDEDRRRAKLAFDLFVDRILAYVGAYYFKILGTGATHIDALVFSGGIGEHSSELRMALAAKLEHSPLALRSTDGGHYGSDKVGGVCRILGPAKEERSLSRWPPSTEDISLGTPLTASAPGSSKPASGAHGITPGSPLGPMSMPGSPRTQHAHPCSGRWGVPWLVCETDEELECVRLAMPTIRNCLSSLPEGEEETTSSA